MSVQVRIPTQLRPLLGGASEIDATGDTVSGVIGDLGRRFPAVAPRLLDESGELRRFVNLCVDDEDVRFLQGLDTPVPQGPASRSSRRSRGDERERRRRVRRVFVEITCAGKAVVS